MDSAIRRGQWQQALEFVDDVLVAHPDNAEAIASVARVVFENGQEDRAADLLVRACRAESFANSLRVQQAIVAMIGVGRLHEGMAILEDAVQAQPQQRDTRRWLYDFYMGTENRPDGLLHGRRLVRERAFDMDLLTSLSNTERRTLDAEPLDEMAARNPDDVRPLLGKAKTEFDAGRYSACIEILRNVVAAHPDYLPSQALLCRVLAADSRFGELQIWLNAPPNGISRYPEYWLALGDWLRADNRHSEAARAYWEATRRDVDWMEPWNKLGTEMEAVAAPKLALPAAAIEGIKTRAERLSRFNLLKVRFERTGKISRATVIEMVDVLHKLGRLWEAEAWASIALSLPEDDAVDAVAARAAVVAAMSKETPWQLTAPFPELQIDLQVIGFDRIAIAGSDDSDRDKPIVNATHEPSPARDRTQLALANEASARNLAFFGRTSDRLQEPGIMLYQTLGCGGGAIDYDRDGWCDIYLAAAGGTPPAKDSMSNALFRNVDGQFFDATDLSATGDRGFSQGIAVGDVNEDGFPDLLVLNYGPNALLINNGDGTFTDRSHQLPNNFMQWSTSGAIADIDNDGIADIAIVNYCASLAPVTVACPSSETGVTQSCSPMKFDAEMDQFLQGSPTGMLQDRTVQWQATPTVPGRGLGVVAGNFDGSVGIEVLIANDMTNNHLWICDANAKEFRLKETAMPQGLGTDDRALAQGSMGIATGDLDGDGDIDFYVTNFNQEYNTFHAQQDAGIWQDFTSRLGLSIATLPLVGFGAEAIDLDRDSNLDLIVTNGHVDIFNRNQTQSIYAQPMQVFRRNDSGRFVSAADELSGEYCTSPHVGRAMWSMDVNRDAQVDLAVTHQTEPVAILVNHTEPSGAWLELVLVGKEASRDAIGAVVTLTAGSQTFTAAQVSGNGYLCSNERIIRFGLDGLTESTPIEVTVRWPDGASERLIELEANTRCLIVQDSGEAFSLFAR